MPSHIQIVLSMLASRDANLRVRKPREVSDTECSWGAGHVDANLARNHLNFLLRIRDKKAKAKATSQVPSWQVMAPGTIRHTQASNDDNIGELSVRPQPRASNDHAELNQHSHHPSTLQRRTSTTPIRYDSPLTQAHYAPLWAQHSPS
jgi:hypothetical protein